MRYAVVGGDIRFAHLASMLNESGRKSRGFLLEKAGAGSPSLEELKQYSAVISNWPMRCPLAEREIGEERILEMLAPGSTLLLCGPKFPKERRWDLQYENLWEDERLLQENAWLTAEAAAAIAARRLGQSMMNRRCAVIGYGRIGRALTEILLNLGAQVRVFSGTQAKRRQIMEAGAEIADLAGLGAEISNQQIIFSTPPANVMDENVLRFADKEALILDLASPPYGVDLEVAQKLGLQAWREPGLPGRYCPVRAARAIYHAVLRWEEAENHE